MSRKYGIAIVILIFLILGGVIFIVRNNSTENTASFLGLSNVSTEFDNPAYLPQLSRNAEFGATAPLAFSDEQVDNIAKNDKYFFFSKWHMGFDIAGHFADAKRIKDKAATYGNDIQLIEYYGAMAWFKRNFSAATAPGWGNYADGFTTDWYLKDVNGNPIVFNGTGSETAVAGYVVDLTNPEYRKFAVDIIVDWMNQAPLAGILFDNADLISGTIKDNRVTNGGKKWNELLCGANAPVDADGNCDRVAAWNQGLKDLISEARAALHPLGKEVYYNGISANPLHGPDRNTALFDQSDGTTNEASCYIGVATTFNSVSGEGAIVNTQTARGKKVFEITNYGTDDRLKYGPYCLGVFLVNWVPTKTYYVYHKGYDVIAENPYPLLPEQNLNLGSPTAGAVESDGLYTRTFDHGFIAVNATDAATTLTIPEPMTEFRDGGSIGVFDTGDSLTVPARDATFFLYNSYLHNTPPPEPKETRHTISIGSIPRSSGGSTITSSTTTEPSPTPAQQSVFPTPTYVPPSPPPAPAVEHTTKPLNQPVSNTIDFSVTETNDSPKTSAFDVVKIEYKLNTTLVHTTTTFPDTWSLDTTTLPNGYYTMTGVYTYGDGTTRQSINFFTVRNEYSWLQKLSRWWDDLWN